MTPTDRAAAHAAAVAERDRLVAERPRLRDLEKTARRRYQLGDEDAFDRAREHRAAYEALAPQIAAAVAAERALRPAGGSDGR